MAMYHYKTAADAGHSSAQLHVGILYYSGFSDEGRMEVGYTYNYVMGTVGSSEQSDTTGLLQQGNYGCNEDTGQDYHLAFKYFYMSAEQENPSAQFNLALMYRSGQGTVR
eukprot:TRINITY_DN16167_c0_g1_i3.p2 TRINITY_DN16167_c0_g1~~TRINITY_DN16167_c0_g1_i3.p2  ORF type:complete len:110 (+),score=19.91 TRINITY_DN16167_c0_g1_i3:595-924(+)